MPDVSVVIPTHNRRRLLGQTARSALGQVGVEVEVIVVDDGSSDGTADAVASIGDDRIRLLRHQKPLGVAMARNAGAGAARGSWVALLDDDDLWAPDKLKRQLEAAAAAEAGWVYAGVVEVDAEGRLLGGSAPPSPEELLAGLRRRNLMPAGSSNVVVRSDLLSASGGFDPRLRHLADWDLWLRLAGLGRPACVPAPLVAYRLHHGQATLDTTGMLAEASTLEARHGADRTAILRWAAWSHLRTGHRRATLARRLARTAAPASDTRGPWLRSPWSSRPGTAPPCCARPLAASPPSAGWTWRRWWWTTARPTPPRPWSPAWGIAGYD
jgi:glycosyltransferase involved in cell wall biosynthesis